MVTHTGHELICKQLQASAVLRSFGFSEARDFYYARRGENHHDLLVFTKPSWRLPCTDAACGYEGVYLHFEYERAGVLLLHLELYPRQGSESKHPLEQIQPLLKLKGEVAEHVREVGQRGKWASSVDWVDSGKDLGLPRNLQVGKFHLGLGSDPTPEKVVAAIEQVVQTVVPWIDEIMPDVES